MRVRRRPAPSAPAAATRGAAARQPIFSTGVDGHRNFPQAPAAAQSLDAQGSAAPVALAVPETSAARAASGASVGRMLAAPEALGVPAGQILQDLVASAASEASASRVDLAASAASESRVALAASGPVLVRELAPASARI